MLIYGRFMNFKLILFFYFFHFYFHDDVENDSGIRTLTQQWTYTP